MALDIFVRRFGRFCSRPNERRSGKSGERAGWKARPDGASLVTGILGAVEPRVFVEQLTAQVPFGARGWGSRYSWGVLEPGAIDMPLLRS